MSVVREGVRSAPYQPLYARIQALLMRRIADQVWRPGDMLPSEGQIAAELGVSQGTVRKALDVMTAENLLVRRQGRGTFVARHDDARILFQFFRLTPDTGDRLFPESVIRSVAHGLADAREQKKLNIGPDAAVIRVHRIRSLAGEPTVSEYLVLPEALFAGIDDAVLPNNLYLAYATRFGVTIAGGSEQLKAVALSSFDAAALGLAPGTPAIAIDRVATAIDGTPAEWRVSICVTETCHYFSSLG